MKSSIEKTLEFMVKDDLNHLKKSIGKRIAEEIRERLVKAAGIAIESFYNDYRPDYYHRTYGFITNAYKPYYTMSGDYYYGGIRLTPEDLPDVYQTPRREYQNDKYGVYQSVIGDYENVDSPVFLGGWHGPTYMRRDRFRPFPMRPDPLHLILDERKKIINNPKEIIDKALSNIRKEQFNILEF